MCICCLCLGRRKQSEGCCAAVTSLAKLVICNLLYFSALQWRRSVSPGDYVHQRAESHPQLLAATVAGVSAVLFIFNRISGRAKAFPSGSCSSIVRGHQPLLPLSRGASCFISRPLFLVSANDPWKLIGSALSEISIRLILPREIRGANCKAAGKKKKWWRGTGSCGWSTLDYNFYSWWDHTCTWSDSNRCYIRLCVCKVLACVSAWRRLSLEVPKLKMITTFWLASFYSTTFITHLVVQGQDLFQADSTKLSSGIKDRRLWNYCHPAAAIKAATNHWQCCSKWFWWHL